MHERLDANRTIGLNAMLRGDIIKFHIKDDSHNLKIAREFIMQGRRYGHASEIPLHYIIQLTPDNPITVIILKHTLQR